MTTTKPKTPQYEAKIKIMGKSYSGTGKSPSEAIKAIKGGNLKGVGVLTVSRGKVSKDKILTSMQVSRLFTNSPTMREFAIKNVSLLFDL